MEERDDNNLATMSRMVLSNSRYGNIDWNEYSNYDKKLKTISTNQDYDWRGDFDAHEVIREGVKL